MPRYIDADALKPDYIVGSTSTNTECYRYVSLKQIVNAPTADVVEVVRCEYCKHRIVDSNDDWCECTGCDINPVGFCEEGERREDATD